MTCFILDLPCHAENLENWFWALPWLALYVGLLLGSVAGAMWGWPVPIGLTVAGLLRFVPLNMSGKRVSETAETEHESGRDFAPPPRPAPLRKRKTLVDRIREKWGG